ncbi:MAG TPA: hypothetical protein DIW31_05460 [Bacteroidales bacterium]|nr:hypothetical protein [Bacteroidales bacterium]
MEYIVVAILICYVAYLHLQLNKKNNLIESMVGKLTKLEKEWDTQHVLNLLEKLRQLSSDSNLKRDKLFDENVMKFLFGNDGDSKIFVHYTKEESVAKKILEDGFIFVDSFEKTVEQIINDSVDLTYKHNIRKYYGKYIIVICISNDIYNRYDQELKNLDMANIQVEQVLTEIPSCFNDNKDEVFTLSKRFIKGYVNYETGETEFNSIFNPYFSSTAFNDNLIRIKS